MIDGGGGSGSYYNELHQNQILNAQTGVLLKDAANANLILGNVFLSGVFGVIVTNSYGNRIAFNTFQDLTNGFGIWFTGSSYGNSAEGNWCERMMHGVYSDGTTHDNYVHGNKYSVIGGTEKRGWGGPKIYEQNIDESAINTFLEVGQFRQVKRLLPWLNTTWPVDTSSNYDNGIFAIPQDSALTNNSALIGEVRNTAGTRSFVPFLVPEGVETITAGNTTPDVYLKKFIRTANTSSTTITDFKNGRNGQVFTLFVNDSNTTITFGSSSPIRGANIKASYKCREGDVFQFIQDSGGVWRALSISPYLWGFTVSDSSGLQIRPTTGSSWDYAVLKADGSTAAVYMPTGTTKMLFQDAIAIGNGTEIRKVLSVSATLKFPSTAAQADSDLTLTLTGAAVGDVVSLGIPNSSVVSGGTFTAWVSAADTVTVRFSNYSSSAKDPASGTFRAMVTQF